MADATGETRKPLRVAFDRRLKLEFHGARITSDGGLLAYRELDDALGLITLAASLLSDNRRGRNTQHRMIGLLRQAVYGRLAGYEDVNDAARLAQPTSPTRRRERQAENGSRVCEIAQTGLRPQADGVFGEPHQGSVGSE